jgi:hypothetical protein
MAGSCEIVERGFVDPGFMEVICVDIGVASFSGGLGGV